MDHHTTWREHAIAAKIDARGHPAANNIPTPPGGGEPVPKPLNSEGCGDLGLS